MRKLLYIKSRFNSHLGFNKEDMQDLKCILTLTSLICLIGFDLQGCQNSEAPHFRFVWKVMYSAICFTPATLITGLEFPSKRQKAGSRLTKTSTFHWFNFILTLILSGELELPIRNSKSSPSLLVAKCPLKQNLLLLTWATTRAVILRCTLPQHTGLWVHWGWIQAVQCSIHVCSEVCGPHLAPICLRK